MRRAGLLGRRLAQQVAGSRPNTRPTRLPVGGACLQGRGHLDVASHRAPSDGGPARRGASSWLCVETPNPDVRKFEFEHTVPSAASTGLAVARGRLMELDGVIDVFVAGTAPQANPWIAVTRSTGTSWDALTMEVQAVLRELPSEAERTAEAAEGDGGGTSGVSEGVQGEIEEVLLHRVRPSVQADGGDVELLRWEAATGEVVLRLRGACRGCPQSAVTLQETILKTLKFFVPDVRSVSAEEEELDPEAGADPSADIPWAHVGEPDPAGIRALAASGTPFFSTFAGMKVEGRVLRRVQFSSRLELDGRTPGHIFVSCAECKARRTIEDPQDLLRKDKGNEAGNAAVVICPTCCVLISP